TCALPIYGEAKITADAIIAALSNANVTLQATNNIDVSAAINAGSNINNLTLEAGNEILIKANMSVGAGDMVFVAGSRGCGDACSELMEGQTRSFSLIDGVQLSTSGKVIIKAADYVNISGSVGSSSNPTSSVSVQAGNNINLASTSSIFADNDSPSSPSIYLSAGDTSLTTGADYQLASPVIDENNALTGNLLIEGQLTTAGGDISLSATGNSSRATTGLVTVRREI